MSHRKNNLVILAASALGLLGSAWAARADVVQTLDSVDAMTSKAVLEMKVGGIQPDECAPDDYACITASLPSAPPLLAGIPAAATFAACQRSADRNMYCVLNSFTSGSAIKQPVVRYSLSGNFEALFDCTDPALALDTKKPNPCSSISADLGGNLWIAGRDGSSYSIIKVIDVPQGAACPAGFGGVGTATKLSADTSATSDFCALRYVSGRPIVVDMSAIDAKVGKAFEAPGVTAGPGVLLLEDSKTVTFLPDRTDVNGNPIQLPAVAIASGKTDFALTGNESVQSTTLMQVNCTSATACDNYLLVSTSTGRVTAKRTDPLGAAFQFYALPACTTTVQQAWVRVSPQSGRIYVSDRCTNKVRGFSVSQTAYVPGSPVTQVEDLSTAAATSSTVTLNSLSVSPGIPINLAKCGATPCLLFPDGQDVNTIGAQISNVNVELLTGKTGMTVFRITGIPDCRFINPLPAICTPDAVETIGGEQYLHVEKLLPLEVTKLFDEYTTPTLANLKLIVGPQFRARPDRGNTFDAFFGRTEDGVHFRSSFDLNFDIRELMGDPAATSTRCGYLNDGTAANPRSPDNWDVITTVSERVAVAGANNGSATQPTGALLNRDMLVNTSCQNPTAGSGGRWSLYAYGLMQSVCVNGSGNIDNSTLACRASFVNLTDQLFNDLERARRMTACVNVDGNPNNLPPLTAATCSALEADWGNSRDKLDKCLAASSQPKISALKQTCNAFDQQFSQYQSVLGAAVVNGTIVGGVQTGDLANRLGEMKARLKVFLHVYTDQFMPSVPPGGIQP